MTDRAREDMQRLTDLLADRATSGISAAEEAELQQLLNEVEGAAEIAAQYDALEGGLVLATHAGLEPLPADLRASLVADGERVVRGQRPARSSQTAPLLADGPAPIPFEPAAARLRASGWDSWQAKAGWLVAAAAVALAAVAWWPAGPGDLPPTGAALRAELEREAPDAVTVALTPADSAPAGGQPLVADVVWSDAQQRGFLRVRGLRINDPAVEQYQLWITDGTRDASEAVTAAVFDITPGSIDPATQEVIIPLDPALAIGRATAFAITIEHPGGAVVSDRSRLVASATIG